jgi:hypothetical protein
MTCNHIQLVHAKPFDNILSEAVRQIPAREIKNKIFLNSALSPRSSAKSLGLHATRVLLNLE